MENPEMKIPDEFIEEMRNMRPDMKSGNGQVDEEYQREKTKALKFFNQAIGVGLKSFDDKMKDKDLPGLGDMNPERLAELTTIVGERNLPDYILEKTPELSLISILAGIASMNVIALRKKKKQKKNSETEPPQKGENGNHDNND